MTTHETRKPWWATTGTAPTDDRVGIGSRPVVPESIPEQGVPDDSTPRVEWHNPHCLTPNRCGAVDRDGRTHWCEASCQPLRALAWITDQWALTRRQLADARAEVERVTKERDAAYRAQERDEQPMMVCEPGKMPRLAEDLRGARLKRNMSEPDQVFGQAIGQAQELEDGCVYWGKRSEPCDACLGLVQLDIDEQSAKATVVWQSRNRYPTEGEVFTVVANQLADMGAAWGCVKVLRSCYSGSAECQHGVAGSDPVLLHQIRAEIELLMNPRPADWLTDSPNVRVDANARTVSGDDVVHVTAIASGLGYAVECTPEQAVEQPDWSQGVPPARVFEVPDLRGDGFDDWWSLWRGLLATWASDADGVDRLLRVDQVNAMKQHPGHRMCLDFATRSLKCLTCGGAGQ